MTGLPQLLNERPENNASWLATEVATETVPLLIMTFRLGYETLCWKNGS